MFSQNLEERVILNYFGDFKGTLLDAGANDGVTFSNSRQLMVNGWAGHLWEPSSVQADLRELYKGNSKATIYSDGLGATNAMLYLNESGAHVRGGNDRALVSTFHKEEMSKWGHVEFKEKSCFVIAFGDWYKKAGSPTLDFITIDIEGMDWELLQAIDLTAVGCKCLCIEWNSKPEMALLFKSYCSKFGLREIHRNSENIIFAV